MSVVVPGLYLMYIESWNSFIGLIVQLILFLLIYISSKYLLHHISYIMEPEATVNRSLKWRIWHSTNYNIGSVLFLIGSLLLLPHASILLPASATISAWLYTIGSFCFTLADFTEWTHYQPKVVCASSKCCRHYLLSFNFLISLTGSFVYLVGSAAFLPQINELILGLKLFIGGSSLVFFSQSWKIIRVIKEGCKKGELKKTICEDWAGVLVDIFAGIGGLMYLIGSFFFFDPDNMMQLIAASIFSFGGFFFYLSGAFMIKRYFLQSQSEGQIAVPSSELKFESKEMQEVTNN